MDIIRLARRNILEFGGKLWPRKYREFNFDIMMGSIDSAQITDLVGLYILQEIKCKIPTLRGGLYRDDALFITRCTNRILENNRKALHKFFQEINLKITIDNNIRVVNFLDLTLNLNDGTYRPFHKPNQIIYYLDRKSNHPRSVNNAIIPSISMRISK